MDTHLKISPLQEENLHQGIGFLQAAEDGYAVPAEVSLWYVLLLASGKKENIIACY